MKINKDKNGFSFKLGYLGWFTIILALLIFSGEGKYIPDAFNIIPAAIKSLKN